jgi:hypothetical protein
MVMFSIALSIAICCGSLNLMQTSISADLQFYSTEQKPAKQETVFPPDYVGQKWL